LAIAGLFLYEAVLYICYSCVHWGVYDYPKKCENPAAASPDILRATYAHSTFLFIPILIAAILGLVLVFKPFKIRGKKWPVILIVVLIGLVSLASAVIAIVPHVMDCFVF